MVDRVVCLRSDGINARGIARVRVRLVISRIKWVIQKFGAWCVVYIGIVGVRGAIRCSVWVIEW